VKTPLRFRLIAAGFLLGATVHGAELVGLTFHHTLRPDYPAWRHALFVVLEVSIAAIAVTQPNALWVAVVAFLGQQLTTHGVDVWQAWFDRRQIDWLSVVTLAFLVLAAAVALKHRFIEKKQGDLAAQARRGEVPPLDHLPSPPEE
jgi:hypothetical protein